MGIRRLLATVGLLLWSVPSMAPAAEPTEVGYVEVITGPSSAYSLRRGAVEVPVRVLTPIYQGDEVRVLEENNRLKSNSLNRIVLNFNNARPAANLTFSDTRHGVYTVPSVAQQGKGFAKLLNLVSDQFGQLHSDQYRAQVMLEAMQSRGNDDDELSIPLLASGVQHLAAGRRALALAWSGGKPPFHLLLRSETGLPMIADANDIVDRRVVLPMGELKTGTYVLKVTDAKDKSVIVRFESVDASLLPRAPQELELLWQESALPDIAKRSLWARWLCDQGGHLWWAEAYQAVAATGGGYYPAILVRDRLEAGF